MMQRELKFQYGLKARHSTFRYIFRLTLFQIETRSLYIKSVHIIRNSRLSGKLVLFEQALTAVVLSDIFSFNFIYTLSITIIGIVILRLIIISLIWF